MRQVFQDPCRSSSALPPPREYPDIWMLKSRDKNFPAALCARNLFFGFVLFEIFFLGKPFWLCASCLAECQSFSLCHCLVMAGEVGGGEGIFHPLLFLGWTRTTDRLCAHWLTDDEASLEWLTLPDSLCEPGHSERDTPSRGQCSGCFAPFAGVAGRGWARVLGLRAKSHGPRCQAGAQGAGQGIDARNGRGGSPLECRRYWERAVCLLER